LRGPFTGRIVQGVIAARRTGRTLAIPYAVAGLLLGGVAGAVFALGVVAALAGFGWLYVFGDARPFSRAYELFVVVAGCGAFVGITLLGVVRGWRHGAVRDAGDAGAGAATSDWRSSTVPSSDAAMLRRPGRLRGPPRVRRAPCVGACRSSDYRLSLPCALPLTADCAAASRAMGTRNGEHET
jgi:hypothetical protein